MHLKHSGCDERHITTELKLGVNASFVSCAGCIVAIRSRSTGRCGDLSVKPKSGVPSIHSLAATRLGARKFADRALDGYSRDHQGHRALRFIRGHGRELLIVRSLTQSRQSAAAANRPERFNLPLILATQCFSSMEDLAKSLRLTIAGCRRLLKERRRAPELEMLQRILETAEAQLKELERRQRKRKPPGQ